MTQSPPICDFSVCELKMRGSNKPNEESFLNLNELRFKCSLMILFFHHVFVDFFLLMVLILLTVLLTWGLFDFSMGANFSSPIAIFVYNLQ